LHHELVSTSSIPFSSSHSLPTSSLILISLTLLVTHPCFSPPKEKNSHLASALPTVTRKEKDISLFARTSINKREREIAFLLILVSRSRDDDASQPPPAVLPHSPSPRDESARLSH
jgi:hypothetical protein